ncbi:MAG TPA: tetratricopeptide repeat protein [Pyrinomonadaceae bacterium]
MSIRNTVFALLLVFSFTITLAFAQTASPKPKQDSQAKPTATPVSDRDRRGSPATESTPAQSETKADVRAEEAAAEPSPVKSPAAAVAPSAQVMPPTKAAEKTSEKSDATDSSTPSDPITALREEIEAAETPQDRIRLQLKLAEELAGTGKKTEAIAELHAVTGVDVFDPQAFYNTGNALARLGDTAEAIAAYRKAIEQRKGRYSRASNNLGVVLLRVGRWDEAQEAFLSALRVEAFHYAEASYNLGRLYATRGQMDLAVREWRRAVAVDPQHSAAKQALAGAGSEGTITVEQTRPSAKTEQQPRKSAAARYSTKPLTLDSTTYGFLQRARSASERGNKTEAIDAYQRVIALQNGYFAPANLELGYLLIGLKRNDEAMTALSPVVNREGSRYPISYYHVARLYELRGELKLAEDAFAQAAASSSQNGQFLLDLSRVREKQGNFKGALDAMEQYVSLVKKDGQDSAWSEERVVVLREKAKQ